MDTPLIVSIVVENVSNSRIEQKTIPAFTLINDLDYWCTVYIMKEKHLPANHRSIISLGKGASITSNVDIETGGLDSQSQDYICATVGARVSGFCSLTVKNNLWQQGHFGHIDELVVNEHYRGQGTGSKLLTQIIKIARKNGCQRIELDSAFHREDAHKCYELMGFENRALLFSMQL